MKMIAISGFLDEAARFPQLSGKIAGRLDIDLQNLEQMNSTGCRNWVIWIKNIQATEGIFLHNCPPQFITHASILFGLIPPGTRVQSFYVPYYCTSCGASERQRFERGKDFRELSSIQVPDTIVCPVCSAVMRIDVVKDIYLRFLEPKSA